MAVAAWLVVLPLAGCASPPADGGDGGGPPPPAPPPDACSTGDRVQWAAGFRTPRSGSERLCWRNANASSNGTPPFTFVALRDGGEGEWWVTVRDGADETFLDLAFGPGRNYRCDDDGRPAVPGNWTIDVRYRNATGNPTLRIDVGEPDDWQCI